MVDHFVFQTCLRSLIFICFALYLALTMTVNYVIENLASYKLFCLSIHQESLHSYNMYKCFIFSLHADKMWINIGQCFYI